EPVMSLPPLNVLIADDVAQNLELLALTLYRNGHTVVTARDGNEAVQRFKAARFDVVLMDVHMPGVDGLKACRIIRALEEERGLPRTPIIALTASVMPEDRRAAAQAGMDGFAVKPLEVPALLNEIARVVTQGWAAAHPAEESACADPDATDMPVVDWEQGEALWGDRAKLAQAALRFLDSVDEQYPLPQQKGEMDADPLLFSLHGIRGAAGNLALRRLAQRAGDLETRLREGRSVDSQPLVELGTVLERARRAVQHELGRGAGDTSPSGIASQSTSADRAVTDSGAPHFLTALQDLREVTRRQEWDEALLETVCRHLETEGRHTDAGALRDALDS